MKSAAENVVYRVGESKFGSGVFARKPLSAGDAILTFTGKPIHYREAVKRGPLEVYCLQIGEVDYLDLEWPGGLVNHSCDPNAGILRGIDLVAVRSIAPGEEIFYDYSTTVGGFDTWTMKCACGSSQCRGLISRFDELPGDVKKRYRDFHIVSPFLLASEHG